MKRVHLFSLAALAGLIGGAPPAQQPVQWQIYKIGNTGVPGGEVTLARIDPEGDVWVSSTDPWNPSGVEGGVAEFDGAVWKTYANTNSPLPTPFVSSVAFGADGSEWIATNGGLIKKKNGVWTRYTSANSQLPNNSMGFLTFDSKGWLWMLHYNGTVTRFNTTNTWRSWSQAQIGWVPSIVPETLVVDANDDVWVGTAYAGGFAKLDLGSQGPDARWQIQGNGAPKFFGGDDGKVWAIDLDINLRWKIFRYEGMQRTQMPDFGPGNIPYSTLRILADGTYWAGTFTGLVGYNDGAGFRTWQFNSSHVYTIDVDADGNAWVAGKGHAKKLDPETGQWTYYNLTTTGLADRGIQHIEFDTEGRAWIGTTTGGLSEFDGTVWRGHSPYNGGTPFWPISTNGVHSGIAAHPDGDLWIGADIEGVLQWNGVEWIRHPMNSFIDAVGVAADGSVWAGPVAGGLTRWDGNAWSSVPLPLFCEIRSIHGAPNGDVFVCDRCALHRWDGTGWTRYTDANTGMIWSNVNDFEIAPDGSWWIATTRGLVHFDGVTWTNYTEANSGVPADVISCVEVTPNGDVWCGAFNGQSFPYYGGVARFDGTTWTLFNSSNSPMEDEQIYSMEVGPAGNVWIGQAQGGLMIAKVGSETFPSRWSDLGQGLPGTGGSAPQLIGQGSLLQRSTFGLKVDDALGGSMGILALGATQVNAPFLGGVFVPSPDLALPIAANSGGRSSLVLEWPAGVPSGLQLVAQAWLLDPVAVQGVAASNAMVATTP